MTFQDDRVVRSHKNEMNNNRHNDLLFTCKFCEFIHALQEAGMYRFLIIR